MVWNERNRNRNIRINIEFFYKVFLTLNFFSFWKIGVVSCRMGALSAFLIPAFLITNEADLKDDKVNIYYMYLVLSITCTLIFISSLLGDYIFKRLLSSFLVSTLKDSIIVTQKYFVLKKGRGRNSVFCDTKYDHLLIRNRTFLCHVYLLIK